MRPLVVRPTARGKIASLFFLRESYIPDKWDKRACRSPCSWHLNNWRAAAVMMKMKMMMVVLKTSLPRLWRWVVLIGGLECQGSHWRDRGAVGGPGHWGGLSHSDSDLVGTEGGSGQPAEDMDVLAVLNLGEFAQIFSKMGMFPVFDLAYYIVSILYLKYEPGENKIQGEPFFFCLLEVQSTCLWGLVI